MALVALVVGVQIVESREASLHTQAVESQGFSRQAGPASEAASFAASHTCSVAEVTKVVCVVVVFIRRTLSFAKSVHFEIKSQWAT